MKPRATAMALLVAAVFDVTSVAAQSDPARDDARARFARAVEMMQNADWNSAIPELERVRAVMETLPVLYNLGLAHRAVGHTLAARAAFRAFLEDAGDSVREERRREVEGFLTELDAAVAHLTLDVAPPTCAVSIDGRDGAHHGDRVELDPGTHAVITRCDGYQPEARTLTLTAGATESVTLRPVALPRITTLRVDSAVADANISVDGLSIGTGRGRATLTPGRHLVEVVASGYRPWRRELTLEHGVELTVTATPERIPLVARPWFWGVIGATVAVSVAVPLTVYFVDASQRAVPVSPTWGVVRTP
jgi:PEGA domain